MVTHQYGRPDPAVRDGADSSRGGAGEGRAVVARYARGADYHDVMTPKLRSLHGWLESQSGGKVAARPYVDTGPLLERELAWRAGLGWQAKNTMLIHPQRGSYFFLGVLLTDLELRPDEPITADHCGSCDACLTGCPTGALLGRRSDGAPVMDARRCISYLTIELRGPIPRDLRAAMGNRVFGCDICQEMCPWNLKFAEEAEEPAYSSRSDLDGASLIDLAETLLTGDDEAFRAAFRRSPVSRTRRAGLLRNVCVALGNWGAVEGVPVLVRALADPDPVVRGHAAWALGCIPSALGYDALAECLADESDPTVVHEAQLALGS